MSVLVSFSGVQQDWEVGVAECLNPTSIWSKGRIPTIRPLGTKESPAFVWTPYPRFFLTSGLMFVFSVTELCNSELGDETNETAAQEV